MSTRREALRGPQYWLAAEHGEATIIDDLLPSEFLSEERMPFIRDAAFSPLTWAAIDKSQLCFDKDGPIEATDLKRFLGIYGQVLLEIALGADPKQVEAHLYHDYINDAAHRMYSHSSDFLIQSFDGKQSAHDIDGRAIVEQFGFMTSQKARELAKLSARPYVTNEYPDLNIDRTEFGLRQMAGMGWLGRQGAGTKTRIGDFIGIDDKGSLVVKDIDFGIKFFIGFCLLGSESWLNPLQKAALQNQQHYLKHKMSSPFHETIADYFGRLYSFKGRVHPYDGLYSFEWDTDDRRRVVDGDQISRDFELVARALASLSQIRERVHEVRQLATDIAEQPRRERNFVHPLDPLGEREAVPIGLSIVKSTDSFEGGVFYDPKREALVFSTPRAMKSRVLDPELAEGGRLCDGGWLADYKAGFETFTQEDFLVILHGVDSRFGYRYTDNIRRVNDAYAEALETKRMTASELSRVLDYIGRLSMSSAQNLAFQNETAYPFVIIADDILLRENKSELEKTRQLLYGPSVLEV